MKNEIGGVGEDALNRYNKLKLWRLCLSRGEPAAKKAPNQWVFCGKVLPFCGKKFEKGIFKHEFPFIEKKIANYYYNSLQHERMLKIFLLSYFEYRQTWLNILLWMIATRATSQIWRINTAPNESRCWWVDLPSVSDLTLEKTCHDMSFGQQTLLRPRPPLLKLELTTDCSG